MYGLDEMSANGLCNLFINDLDVQSINVRPRDVYDLHNVFVAGLKRLPVNVCSCDVREPVDVTSDRDKPVLNGPGPESALNGLNGLNGLGPELDQEL